MSKKLLTIWFVICLTLLASCSMAAENDHQPNASGDQSQEEASRIADTIWDDRTIFAKTLNESSQQDLSALPEASTYHITLTIPEKLTEPLTGEMKVRYFNQESQSLEKIYFRLFPNYNGGLLSVEDIEVDGVPAETQLESYDTSLRVDLAQPLSPGESVMITMKYVLQLPETMSGNYGLLGYFEGILVLDTFYPMIPAYDDDGWYAHHPYQNGDITYNDASFYLVEITAPEDFIIASSGSVVEESKQGAQQHLTIASGPARDFFLAGSTQFSVISTEVDGITVNSFALARNATMQDLALKFASQSLHVFNEVFGKYPYQEFDVVSSPMQALGIEYPGITGIFLQLYNENGSTYGISNRNLIESVIAHEVGHQWIYNLVGNDQQSEPWVDEALVQYITYQYFVQQYGKGPGLGLIQSWEERWGRIEHEKIPIGLEASEYGDQAYSPIVYGRGPLFYLELEEQLGEEVLLEGIGTLTQGNRWQVVNTEDIREWLEDTCNCDLTKKFEEWIYPVE